jgi:serine/threonine protein phosphatase PrpC
MSGWVGIGRSDIGLVRKVNQDAFVSLDHLGFWAVADGMGGHIGGEIAAKTAIASVKARVDLFAAPLQQGHGQPHDFLIDLVVHAQDAIHGRAKLESKLKGMGTTLVMLLILPSAAPAGGPAAPTAHIAHVGDSRAYRFRSGTLTPLTRDHTLIEKYMERGLLTPEAARTHPERHVLTRALGMPSAVKPDVSSSLLEPSDLLLLCSDGLTKMLEDRDVEDIVAKAKGDPIRACDQLIAHSLARGGEDNVTVIVVAHP